MKRPLSRGGADRLVAGARRSTSVLAKTGARRRGKAQPPEHPPRGRAAWGGLPRRGSVRGATRDHPGAASVARATTHPPGHSPCGQGLRRAPLSALPPPLRPALPHRAQRRREYGATRALSPGGGAHHRLAASLQTPARSLRALGGPAPSLPRSRLRPHRVRARVVRGG